LIYSKQQPEDREYKLPDSFKKYKQVDIHFVNAQDRKVALSAYSANNSVRLALSASTPVLIVPHKEIRLPDITKVEK